MYWLLTESYVLNANILVFMLVHTELFYNVSGLGLGVIHCGLGLGLEKNVGPRPRPRPHAQLASLTSLPGTVLSDLARKTAAQLTRIVKSDRRREVARTETTARRRASEFSQLGWSPTTLLLLDAAIFNVTWPRNAPSDPASEGSDDGIGYWFDSNEFVTDTTRTINFWVFGVAMKVVPCVLLTVLSALLVRATQTSHTEEHCAYRLLTSGF